MGVWVDLLHCWALRRVWDTTVNQSTWILPHYRTHIESGFALLSLIW